jgi:hypothetical protein
MREGVFMEAYFVLDERGEAQRERDIDAWTRWFEQADRSIARTVVTPQVTVLTTFSGIDSSEEAREAPLLFETRVFGGVLDGEEAHHATRAEALTAHSALANWSRIGNAPDAGVNEELLM